MNNTTQQDFKTHLKNRNDVYWAIKKQGVIVHKKLKLLTNYELKIVFNSIKNTESKVKDPNLTIGNISAKEWYKLLKDEQNYREYRDNTIIHSILEALEVTYHTLANSNTKIASQSIYSENYIPRKQLLTNKIN